jgi:hypothetical protein
MIAAIDETTPEGNGGVFYVITAAILLNDRGETSRKLQEVTGPRSRPFHWSQEGSQTRTRMVDLLCELGVLAIPWVHYPTGRKQQESARQKLLSEATVQLLGDGVDELIIETRDAPGKGWTSQDARDEQTLRDTLRSLGLGPEALSWSWQPKSEPLLWACDAICGAVREFLLGDSEAFEQLVRAKVIDEPRYRS